MEFRFVHFYPDLMSLYGSYANLSVLQRLLEQLGHTVTVTPLAPGETTSLAGADLLFMGAGTERSQKAAMESLAPLAGEIRSAAADGMPVFFAGTAMELLGAAITDSSGASFDGIGLADFTSVQGTHRFVEDVYGTTDLYPEAVVGFMNKCSVIHGVQTPLLTSLAMGFGNEGPCEPVECLGRLCGRLAGAAGLLGRLQLALRDAAAVGQPVVAHVEYLRAGAGAQAAADAVLIYCCVHIGHSYYSRIFPSRPSVTTCQGMNLPLCRRAVSAARCIPPQQGTSIRTMVSSRISLRRRISVSFSA